MNNEVQKLSWLQELWQRFTRKEFWEEQARVFISTVITSLIEAIGRSLADSALKLRADAKIQLPPTPSGVGERVWGRPETPPDFRPPQVYPPRESGNSAFPGFGGR
jgi:hypothetical protein